VSTITVAGEEVRSWGDDVQAAWEASSQNDAIPELSLMAEMVEQVQADDRIVEITTSNGEPEEDVSINFQPIVVRYQVEMILFGFIPLEREVEASISTDGNTTIDYPWYRVFTSVPQANQIEQILSALQAQS
jgi:hypothetical protein